MTTTPLEIYKLLDKSNCRECQKESCLEFASELVDRRIKVEECPHLKHPDQIKNQFKIKHLLQPLQWQVSFGKGDRACNIGGEEVIYRHQRTFYNQSAIAIEIHDELNNYSNVVKYLTDLTISRIGVDLQLDAIALRCVSGNEEKYVNFVKTVANLTNLPIILCCWDPIIMEKAAGEIQSFNPLLYAATLETGEAFGLIAKKYNLPLVCHAPNLKDLYNLIISLTEFGIQNLVLDPGTFVGKGLTSLTYNHIQHIRTQLFENNIKSLGYPILGVPASIWADISSLTEFNSSNHPTKDIVSKNEDDDIWKLQYKEVISALILATIDTSLLIMHTGRNEDEIWALLALMTYRQNIFTDPRIYPTVDPGLTIIGEPDEWSPIFITSNYRMTKIPVEQDLIDAKLNSYLVVVDTDGIGIESATAGGQFNEERIKKALDETNVLEKVRHRIIIIPGMAARLQAPIEEFANLEVWVGPSDSSGIPSYIQDNWKMNPAE
jgi:acetyl-CoA decarbonylase/synthase, CODH/ACS complex subunit gamma